MREKTVNIPYIKPRIDWTVTYQVPAAIYDIAMTAVERTTIEPRINWTKTYQVPAVMIATKTEKSCAATIATHVVVVAVDDTTVRAAWTMIDEINSPNPNDEMVRP